MATLAKFNAVGFLSAATLSSDPPGFCGCCGTNGWWSELPKAIQVRVSKNPVEALDKVVSPWPRYAVTQQSVRVGDSFINMRMCNVVGANTYTQYSGPDPSPHIKDASGKDIYSDVQDPNIVSCYYGTIGSYLTAGMLDIRDQWRRLQVGSVEDNLAKKDAMEQLSTWARGKTLLWILHHKSANHPDTMTGWKNTLADPLKWKIIHTTPPFNNRSHDYAQDHLTALLTQQLD